MDRIKGWFWSNNTSDNDKTQSSGPQDKQSALIKTTTSIEMTSSDNENVDSNVNNISQASSKPLPVKPVLIDDTNAKLHTRFFAAVKTQAEKACNKTVAPWFEANTNIQPEDNLVRKLFVTSCATILYISSLSRTTRQWREIKNMRYAILLSKFAYFGLYVIYVKKEWYVALTEPPGEKPRTFVTSMISEAVEIQESISKQLSSLYKNDKSDD